ncbi:MAG: adenosine kinase [Puniceicoccaceae bacterium]|nr:adenosine kinase [Puniceicoccaceae bacterium]RCL29985.1 MAG: adenosine kinase [Puniceicoccaceae bacterium]
MKKIVGLGSPIIDEIAFIEESFLDGLSGAKGGMELLLESELAQLKSSIGKDLERIPGGSAGNTIFALARLGIQTGFIGKIGNCISGRFYKDALAQYGGSTASFKEGSSQNGNCLSLVTPDGERTMRTALGAATELSEEELSDADFKPFDHLHIEGFMIHNPKVLEKSLHLAKSNNCTVSFDLASFEIVNQSRDALKELLKSSVDMVFANEEEAAAFTERPISESKISAEILHELCPIAVVKLGAEGCIIASDQTLHHSEAIRVDTVTDTTGAGDFWAAGFLHGWAHQQSITESARRGALLGSSVIQNHGARLNETQWLQILEQI